MVENASTASTAGLGELTKGGAAGAAVSKVGPEVARPINKIFED